MSKKIGDLAIKVGEYEKDGKTKGRYENIGALMEDDNGKPFMLLKRTFNPAGVPGTSDRDSILVSVFDNQNQNGGGQRQQSSGYSSGYQAQQPRQQSQAARQNYGGSNYTAPSATDDGFDDDIPFAPNME